MREILVTGGKGTTGSIVARELARLGVSHRIATRKPVGSTDVAFDWKRLDLTQATFDTVGALYIVAPTDTTDHAGIVSPMLELAVKQGVTRFVLLSASSLEPDGPMMGQIHSWLARHAPEWAVLRPSWFMQNFHNQHRTAIVDEQAIYTATRDGRVGFIDAGDIARVAVKALTSPNGWNSDYILTGPQSLSYSDVAATLSEELGIGIRHVALSADAYVERLVDQGMDEAYARTLVKMDEQIAIGAEDRVTGHVEELTKEVPATIREFVRRNSEKWQS